MHLRIGITTRIIENQTYSEFYESLSTDWGRYLQKVFPQALIVPLLNEPDKIIKTIEQLGINAIILSNGNDIGEFKNLRSWHLVPSLHGK